jgi:replicative DNA helicase
MDTVGWERILLGSAIHDPKSIVEAQALHIQPEDFILPMHATLWRTIYDLNSRGGLAQSTLVETLRSQEILSDIGTKELVGIDYINYLVNNSDAGGVKESAEQIIEGSTKRRLQEIGSHLIRQSSNGKLVNEIIEDHVKQILELRRVRNGETVHIASLTEDYNTRAEKIRSGEIKPYWYPPIEAIKNRIKSMSNVDFALMVGQPGTGKSSLLRYLGLETSKRGDPALMITFENTHEEYYTWALASMSGVNHTIIIDPTKQSKSDREKIEKAEEELKTLPLYIHEMGLGNLQDVISVCRAFKMKHEHLSFIGVDGIYLMRGSTDNAYETVTANTQGLRSFAQEIHAPIIGTTQFNRRTINKDKSENSDILYAGENAARQIWLMKEKKITASEAYLFPWNLLPDGKLMTGDWNTTVININVSKNTNGPTGLTTDIQWDKPTNTYKSLTSDWNSNALVSPSPMASSFTPAPKPTKQLKQKRF